MKSTKIAKNLEFKNELAECAEFVGKSCVGFGEFTILLRRIYYFFTYLTTFKFSFIVDITQQLQTRGHEGEFMIKDFCPHHAKYTYVPFFAIGVFFRLKFFRLVSTFFLENCNLVNTQFYCFKHD